MVVDHGRDVDAAENGCSEEEEASAFAGGACRKLEGLYLSHNLISTDGIAALASVLKKGALPALKVLSIYHNQIGDEGLKVLLAAAAGGRLAKLENLYIFNNEVSEEGIVALAEAIKMRHLPSLSKVLVDAEHENNPSLVLACALHFVEIK